MNKDKNNVFDLVDECIINKLDKEIEDAFDQKIEADRSWIIVGIVVCAILYCFFI